ncbi:formyltransferase family protein [Halorientalis halophila]|uniref:formyltransferase family protein n=1 Tax=Halorientalis halophila TaxID=3108499 RepID=UPI00300AA6B1
MKRIVVLTSSELRHDFLRKAIALADGIDVVRTYCEGLSGTTLDKVKQEGDEIQVRHLEARDRSERDFFGPFVDLAPDESNPKSVDRGAINDSDVFEEITSLDPDLLVAYGCSIVEDPLLSAFEGRFLNVHLGLSPYYRGTGTNFWPLVNGEPEFVGATFMHLDDGIDTGEVIHQLRARIHPRDSPHEIGNRLISDVATVYPEVIRKFDELEPVENVPEPDEAKYYEKSDYSTEATRKLYENFDSGLIPEYLAEREERIEAAPIVENPVLAQ